MQRRGDRILGPYTDGRGRFRVIVITPGAGQAEGTRRRRTFPTREEAEEYVEAAREELAAAESITIADAIAGYLAHLAGKGDRQTTIDLTERFLLRFFPDRTLLIAHLTPARCQRLYDELQARPTKRGTLPAAATHQQALVQARALLRWAVEQGLHRGPESPAAAVRPQGKRRRGKPQLRIDEGRRWLAKALEVGEPGALMAATALLCGCRAGELEGVAVRDLDDGGAVLWLAGKTNDRGDERPVEVPEPLRVPLLGLTVGKLPGAPLFGRGLEAVGWWARKICELAGIEAPQDDVHGFCAHSLRGMHATYARAAGMSARAVADTLGNSPAVLDAAYTAPGTAAAAAARRAQMRLVR